MKDRRGRTVKVFTLTAVGLGCFIIAGCGTSRPQSDHHHLDKASQAVGQALAWVHKQPQLHVPLEGPRWLPPTTDALSESAIYSTGSPSVQQYAVSIWQTRKPLGVNSFPGPHCRAGTPARLYETFKPPGADRGAFDAARVLRLVERNMRRVDSWCARSPPPTIVGTLARSPMNFCR